ncbi:MAG: hypothetical protein ABII06_06790 [Pseudomonadota bacterium]
MAEKVEQLKKVTLSLEAGSTRNAMEFTSEPVPFTIIFGLGVEGLTPFEKELAHESEGNETVLTLRRDEIHEIFQHLVPPPLHVPEKINNFFLKVHIVKVSEPDQREVISAMAEAARCGHGCCGH